MHSGHISNAIPNVYLYSRCCTRRCLCWEVPSNLSLYVIIICNFLTQVHNLLYWFKNEDGPVRTFIWGSEESGYRHLYLYRVRLAGQSQDTDTCTSTELGLQVRVRIRTTAPLQSRACRSESGYRRYLYRSDLQVRLRIPMLPILYRVRLTCSGY